MSVARQSTIVSALSAAMAAVALSACSGGGGGSMPAPKPSPTAGTCVAGQSETRRTFTANGHTYVMAAMSKSGSAKWVPGKMYVRFAPSAFHHSLVDKLQTIGAIADGQTDRAGFQTFDLPVGQDVDQAVAAMRGQPGVIRAGKLALRYLQVLPNDPFFIANNYQQWALYQINMPTAWNLSIGSPSVHIAIVDTGYDLANFDVAPKVDASTVFVTGSPNSSPQDCDGHGTNVSGIAAAVTNNGAGVAGVGYNVHLLEARVFPYGTNPSASEGDIAAGINWAVANGANVINLSLGSPTDDPGGPEDTAVANAIAAGVIVVAAAGNDANYAAIDFPAANPGVIAVGATSLNDHGNYNNTVGAVEYVAPYSNFSPRLDVVAPGGDPDNRQQTCNPDPNPAVGCPDYLQWILGLFSSDATGAQGPQPDLALFAGTSQATPHVSGLAALMVSKAQADLKTLTPTGARTLVKSHAVTIGIPLHEGSGRIDAHATLNDPAL
ncbi:MAG TPA: S8 family serine peptidase [Candidatus Eremiobacteraceae bacterium]